VHRAYLAAYLAWRPAVEFLKPEPQFAGLTAIQWCCAAALVWYWRDTAALLAPRKEVVAHGRSRSAPLFVALSICSASSVSVISNALRPRGARL